MGTWGVSTKELIEKLVDCLDNIEGDFSNDGLSKALTFLQQYAPTSDSNNAREDEWNKKLKKMFASSENQETKVPTHKKFQKGVDKSKLGY